ncbi:MAG: deoxyribose-phosphate aldolase [Micrococcales bacterium]|jgi:DhnA family fructose-bisphosphate aldolase class Ia|nr:deoxyribose-phosphate aldolase [Micrococcales bacterium]
MELTNTATFESIKDVRAENPSAVRDALEGRKRRDLIRGDGRLLIIAADHPARGAIAVGQNPTAMGSRRELLDRFAEALSRPGVDGVLGTPDVIDDLALMGLLDDKIVVGSMNRGGLRGSSFEFDDRFTGYSIEAIKRQGLDFAKTLLRINLKDAASVATLEANARAVNEAVKHEIPIMLEPFMSHWVDGKVVYELTTDAVVLSVAVAQGLGESSAYSWLKLPVVANMEKVLEATTLPTLLLGGDVDGDQERAFDSWNGALALPGVRGLVVGRSLLYPNNGNVSEAVDIAAKMVHGSNL